jgi:antitoxin MazE
MVVTISRWGNSLGVRIPKGALEQAHLSEGDAVEVVSHEGCITLRPHNAEVTLEQLVDLITPDNVHGEAFELWLRRY